jgi:hypothetical protein
VILIIAAETACIHAQIAVIFPSFWKKEQASPVGDA